MSNFGISTGFLVLAAPLDRAFEVHILELPLSVVEQ